MSIFVPSFISSDPKWHESNEFRIWLGLVSKAVGNPYVATQLTGSGNYTPTFTGFIWVTMQAIGGPGGAGSVGAVGGAGGGSGELLQRRLYPVTLGVPIAYAIGAAGVNTTFGILSVAFGLNGGVGVGGTGGGTTGGAGGAIGAPGVQGTQKVQFRWGGSGGGGRGAIGGAWDDQVGGAASTSGGGASTIFGPGAAGVAAGVGLNAPVGSFGAGGSGGVNLGNAGGNPAAGTIIIET